jgi:hypothetical protein
MKLNDWPSLAPANQLTDLAAAWLLEVMIAALPPRGAMQ